MFLIQSIDYNTNTVTLSASVTNLVTNAVIYTMARSAISASDGNEGRLTIDTPQFRNLMTAWAAIDVSWNSGGEVRVINPKCTNVRIAQNQYIVRLIADSVEVSGGYLSGYADAGSSNPAAVFLSGKDMACSNVRADIATFQNMVRYNMIAQTYRIVEANNHSNGVLGNSIYILNNFPISFPIDLGAGSSHYGANSANQSNRGIYGFGGSGTFSAVTIRHAIGTLGGTSTVAPVSLAAMTVTPAITAQLTLRGNAFALGTGGATVDNASKAAHISES